MNAIPKSIISAALDLAHERNQRLSEVPLMAIASRAGISRATLFRRIGSRAALEEAVRGVGVEPGSKRDVRERAVVAAANIVAKRGLAALTLEAVADEAVCSVPALHTQVGGREGLLAAMFERFSPLPKVQQILTPPTPSFAEGIHALYSAAYDAATAEPRVLPALLGDILIRPGGPSVDSLGGTYVPRTFALLGGWLNEQIELGQCRALPLPLMVQLLIGPMVAHVLSRPALERLVGLEPLPREEVIEQLTAAYVRSVGVVPSEPARRSRE